MVGCCWLPCAVIDRLRGGLSDLSFCSHHGGRLAAHARQGAGETLVVSPLYGARCTERPRVAQAGRRAEAGGGEVAGAGEPPQPRRAPQSGQPPPPTGAQQAPPRPSDHRAEAAAGGAEPPAALAARRGRAKARAGGADATHTLRGGGGARPEGAKPPEWRNRGGAKPRPRRYHASEERDPNARREPGFRGTLYPRRGLRFAARRPSGRRSGQSDKAHSRRATCGGAARVQPRSVAGSPQTALSVFRPIYRTEYPVCPSMAGSPST